MVTVLHDSRIDEAPHAYIGSCACGWRWRQDYGPRRMVKSGDHAYRVVLELVHNHRGAA